MYFWPLTCIFLLVSAICCAIGFKKFVYFLSVGYGFSVIGLGIAYQVVSFMHDTWDIFGILFTILFIIYGVRLSGFLLAREIKNASYRKVLKEATKEGEKKMPLAIKFVIWISVTVLYFAETCPIFYRAENSIYQNVALLRFDNFATVNWMGLIAPIVGVVISIIGLLFETIADAQKTKQKKIEPNMVATKNLYKMCRCPNYFGEIVFWTGVFISGVQTFSGAGQWIMASVGYVCIVYVMFNSAQRLERRQEKRYGAMPEYRQYADHTPILIPLLPIYHIDRKVKKELKK